MSANRLPRPRTPLSAHDPDRRAELKRALDAVIERTDRVARRSFDPVTFVHCFERSDDRELFGLLAAVCAFGNVTTIRAKLTELQQRLGPHPASLADNATLLQKSLDGFKHRVYRGEDLACLLLGARSLQRAHGSLESAFVHELDRADEVAKAGTFPSGADEAFRLALARFCDAIREAGGLPLSRSAWAPPSTRRSTPSVGVQSSTMVDVSRRGPWHVLPDPRAGGAMKRLLLFLRWMIRPADGIDLGVWRRVSTRRLLMPVDVHIHRLSRNLGLTARRDVSWKTATEITQALRELDADDPTRYDFSLCHLGMVQDCPSRADPTRCEGCGVKPVCIHWRLRKPRGAPGHSSASS